MLKRGGSKERRSPYRDGEARHFFDDPRRHPESLGCGSCPERAVCGGLHVDSDAFDCMGYCCGDPDNCDSVCKNNVATFVARLREIGGNFGLEDIPRHAAHPRPELPRLVPMLYHGYNREGVFAPPAVSVPLYSLYDRGSGDLKFGSHAALCEAFRIAPGTQLVVSGTHVDRHLERWWGLGAEARRSVLDALGQFPVAAITSPNFSLFSNAPRWDDMHAMKRIAITWHEMIAAGLNTALHVNARTHYDWRRWRDFVGEREEVNVLAFEFATGAADPIRLPWYVDQLCRLADEVRRPLTLIVRGGGSIISELRNSYANVCLVDTTPVMKAVKRQKASRRNGTLKWVSVANQEVPVEQLLEHNYLEMADEIV